MFDAPRRAGPDQIARDPWFGAERPPPRSETFENLWLGAESLLIGGATRSRGRRCLSIRRAVARAAKAEGADKLDNAALAARARELGRAAARGDPGAPAYVAPVFALIREAAGRAVGMRHHDVQLAGGAAMMRGWLAEMQTGEGKTLTATLAASAMALTGRPVHVVTVNDYLAARDAEEMTPVYAALGLSVGVVTSDMTPDARRTAYAADVTYCTNKDLAFDYLRDRIAGAAATGPLTRRARAAHGGKGSVGLLRGLAFALIDEADSVLIDEARTPLILSGEGPPNFDPALLQAAADAADALVEGRDYDPIRDERRVELTARGRDRLAAMPGPLRAEHAMIREELAVKALTARLFFHRDEQYLLRDGKVAIIDEYTGRVMPDRFWTDGLHQLIELSEGAETSSGRVTLARTTYQRFFRRYDRIAGMSGTAREVARELHRVYRLPVATIPTHKRPRRVKARALVARTAAEKWRIVAREAARLTARGAPVLIGTRSVAASETASKALTKAGIDHVLLSAAQDAEEAAVIGQAGRAGRVTVATNMAGRGADIKLDDAARAAGGLHVIMTEAHDSRRIDRQLEGRAGRQGDPGWFREILSLEDAITDYAPRGWRRRLTLALDVSTRSQARRAEIARAQARAEAAHAAMRRSLFKQDERISDALSFSGPPE